jgi:hypothetical protein
MEILNRCLIMLQFSNASALALSLDAAWSKLGRLVIATFFTSCSNELA